VTQAQQKVLRYGQNAPLTLQRLLPQKQFVGVVGCVRAVEWIIRRKWQRNV
jgi:hypothetical protein